MYAIARFGAPQRTDRGDVAAADQLAERGAELDPVRCADSTRELVQAEAAVGHRKLALQHVAEYIHATTKITCVSAAMWA